MENPHRLEGENPSNPSSSEEVVDNTTIWGVSSFHGAKKIYMRGNVETAGRDIVKIYNGDSSDLAIITSLADIACLGAGHEVVEGMDRPKCHHETRQAVIKDIMSWVDSQDKAQKIMWLNGPAGAGKSSIAQSICFTCKEEGKLLSSFFFSRTAKGTGRDDAKKVIPTIAYHASQIEKEIKRSIIDALIQDPALLYETSTVMNTQFQRLVVKPVCLFAAHYNESEGKRFIPRLLVIDGLDECNDTTMQIKLIELFVSMLGFSDIPVKCLIASRPELEIRNAFTSVPHVAITLENKYKPDKDILTYLLSEFSTIKRTHPLSMYLCNEANWPAEKDVIILVHQSSGQFLYASVVVKYVSNVRHDPIERLQEIIDLRPGKHDPYQEVDSLYRHILSTAARNADGYSALAPIFHVLLYIYYPFMHTISEMASFLGIKEQQLCLRLSDLHSVISLSNVGKRSLKSFTLPSPNFYETPHDRQRIFIFQK